jgi:hypothetical protein
MGTIPVFPLGEVLDAELFTSQDGTGFIAAILGFYEGVRISFDDLKVNQFPDVESLPALPALPDAI